jgi:uncharacterized protein (TIGR02145 family)
MLTNNTIKNNPVQTRFVTSTVSSFIQCYSKAILFFSFLLLFSHIYAQDTTTVKIGQQEWITKNFNAVTFRNGDSIPEAKTYEAWREAGEKGQPAWCYQSNLPEYGAKYGKLYNWYAVTDPRGLAPKGFHVPSKAEWDTLVSYLGGEEIAGKKLKNTEGWLKEGNGTNESGFTALAGGSSGGFSFIGHFGAWWSSSEKDTNNAWNYFVNCIKDNVLRNNDNKTVGLSVRLVRD